MYVPWRDAMEEKSLIINPHALHSEGVWTTVNLLKGFIFPVDYCG
jgi:hypothetical protein